MHTKFADDTKLGESVDSLSGENLQRDLDQLEGRAISNHTEFKKSKCWILCWGKSNPGFMFRGDERLEGSPTESDLGLWLMAS